MAGEEKGQVQGQPSGEGADQTGTEDPAALPKEGDVQAQLSALQQELADQKAQAAITERQLQGKIDKDIAREVKAREDQRQALQAYVKGQMEQAGATSEELATFERDFGSFAEGLSDKEKAARFDEMVATQGVEKQVREFQDNFISGIAEVVGIEIDPHHPDIKRSFEDSPEDFESSVKALAKELLAKKGKKEGKDALDAAAQSGALGSLGGVTGGAVDPILSMTDPDEIHKEWVRRGRPMPKREEA